MQPMQIILKSEFKTRKARKLFNDYYERICLKNSSANKRDYPIWKTAAIFATLAKLGEVKTVLEDEPGTSPIFIEFTLDNLKSKNG